MAQPEHDFFGRPDAAEGHGGFGSADARFGVAGPATNQFAAAPGGLLGNASAGRYGGPAGVALAPSAPAPAPAAGGWSVQPGRRRGPRRLLTGLLLGGLVVVVLVIAAAVVLPFWTNQQAKSTFAATRVVLPASVEGLNRNPAIKTGQQVKQVQRDSDQIMPGVFTVSGQGYGSTGSGVAATVVVAQAKRPLSAAEQARMRLGALSQITPRSGDGPVARPAGRLGGSFDCLARKNAVTCISVDPVSVITITVGHDGAATQVDTARQIREAVELRA